MLDEDIDDHKIVSENPPDKNKSRKEKKKKKKLENKRVNSFLMSINLNHETVLRNSFLRTPIVHIFGFSSSLTSSKRKESLLPEKSLNEHFEWLISQTNKKNSIYTLHTWILNITLVTKSHSSSKAKITKKYLNYSNIFSLFSFLGYLKELRLLASPRMFILSKCWVEHLKNVIAFRESMVKLKQESKLN